MTRLGDLRLDAAETRREVLIHTALDSSGSELVGRLGEAIQGIIQVFRYVGIMLVMAAENIFPPIPSELGMPFASFMAREGKFHIWAVILSGMLGSVMGALVLYYVGVWPNETVIRWCLRRWVATS